jgi:hypothetical protein
MAHGKLGHSRRSRVRGEGLGMLTMGVAGADYTEVRKMSKDLEGSLYALMWT